MDIQGKQGKGKDGLSGRGSSRPDWVSLWNETLKTEVMYDHDFLLKRELETDNSTLGKLLTFDEKFLCYILEDGYREIKVKGETRIPGGRYPLKLRTYGTHHEQYLKKYEEEWHKGMVEICDIPNFGDVLFHIGNTVIDTKGCLLTGLGYGIDSAKNNYILSAGTSRKAYEKIYPVLRDSILTKETWLWVPGK